MSDWPLHVTFADVFAIDRDSTDIDEKMKNVLRSQHAVLVTPKHQAKLGDTAVILVEKTDELLKQHTLIVDLLEQNGAIFNTPAFTREGFLPHCTIQKTGMLRNNVVIDELALVDMFPNGDWQQRKILATFKLGG